MSLRNRPARKSRTNLYPEMRTINRLNKEIKKELTKQKQKPTQNYLQELDIEKNHTQRAIRIQGKIFAERSGDENNTRFSDLHRKQENYMHNIHRKRIRECMKRRTHSENGGKEIGKNHHQ